jgi:hypothetical protein
VRYREIISYPEMVKREGMTLQRGMNFRVKTSYSIVLMSVRKGAPYQDQWHADRGVLEYEGHDVSRAPGVDPKRIDQPMSLPSGRPTDNGKFYKAAMAHRYDGEPPEIVQVYEKITTGIWCDRGRHELVDSAIVTSQGRNVFRFFLKPTMTPGASEPALRLTRQIPTSVKVEVWKRDGGCCVQCKRTDNLHFDHDVPWSKGGSSITSENVRLLCARHNLEKSDKIMAIGPWIGPIVGSIVAQMMRGA